MLAPFATVPFPITDFPKDPPTSQGPHLLVAYLSVSPDRVHVGDIVIVSALVANAGTLAAVNVDIGPASTTTELEVLAEQPESIPLLGPGETVAFTATVRFKTAGDFELGVSGIADNTVLLPETKPIAVSVPGRSSGRIPLWLYSVPAGTILGAAILSVGRKRRAQVRAHLVHNMLGFISGFAGTAGLIYVLQLSSILTQPSDPRITVGIFLASGGCVIALSVVAQMIRLPSSIRRLAKGPLTFALIGASAYLLLTGVTLLVLWDAWVD